MSHDGIKANLLKMLLSALFFPKFSGCDILLGSLVILNLQLEAIM